MTKTRKGGPQEIPIIKKVIDSYATKFKNQNANATNFELIKNKKLHKTYTFETLLSKEAYLGYQKLTRVSLGKKSLRKKNSS